MIFPYKVFFLTKLSTGGSPTQSTSTLSTRSGCPSFLVKFKIEKILKKKQPFLGNLGKSFMTSFGLWPLSKGYSKEYRDDFDPRITNEFATAAFRSDFEDFLLISCGYCLKSSGHIISGLGTPSFPSTSTGSGGPGKKKTEVRVMPAKKIYLSTADRATASPPR